MHYIDTDKGYSDTIAYVLGSRFPTEKAYGVTCSRTAFEIGSANINTKIFSFPSKYTLKMELPRTEIIPFDETVFAQNLRAYGSTGTSRWNQLAWKLSLMRTIRRNMNLIIDSGAIFVWLRDPQIAIEILSRSDKIVILEVHTRIAPKKVSQLQQFTDRVIYCPISKQTLNQVQDQLHNAHIVFSPMAVNPENLASYSQVNESIEKFLAKWDKTSSVGYVGKFSPNGYSKGIEDLIGLALLLKKINSGMTVTIMGGSPKEVDELIRVRLDLGLSEGNLKILGHLDHESAVTSMRDFDILVLPGARSKNYDGMPLKTLEYLSSGKIVVIADTFNHKQIFDGRYQPKWYNAGDEESLYSTIFSTSNKDDLVDLIMGGVNFAGEYTWKNRTQKIIEYAYNLENQRAKR